MTPSEVQSLVDEMARTGQLPKSVPKSTMAEVSKSLARYFDGVSKDKISEFSEKVGELLKGALNTAQSKAGATEGGTRATARGQLLEFLDGATGENIGETMNLDFFLRIPMEVAAGAAQKLAQNWDGERIEAYPGLEFRRVYEREVPRGSEKDPAGPENSWDPDRWQAACEEAGDDDALAAFESSGRMVALKSSGVWQALGDGAGGYDDTLGNDFAPFAFNSGFDTDELAYDECVELGLLEEGEKPEAPELDLEDLIPALEGSRARRTLRVGSICLSGAKNAVEPRLARRRPRVKALEVAK